MNDGQVISRKVGNRSTTAKRSEDGRRGRGADAFTPKLCDDWQKIQKALEEIVKRNQVNGQDGSAARVSDPLHAVHTSFRAVKF